MAMTFVLNMGFVTYAGINDFVSRVELRGNTVTIEGNVNKGESVNIFLLNPDKTVDDLSNALSNELFKQTVNYSNIESADYSGKFTDVFNIKNFDEEKSYLLYVKSQTDSYKQYIMSSEKIYVSTEGSDSTGDGSKEKPYASIDKAKLSLRNKELRAPVEVIISGGTYIIDKSIVFDESDSGTKDYPITYRAADNEKVIFAGTTKLDVTEFKTVSDAGIKQRLSENAADKIVEIDLEEQGIPRNVVDFLAQISVGGTGKPIGIYLNDEPQNIARWPNAGYERILQGSTGGGSASAETTELGGAVIKISNLDEQRAERLKNSIDNLYIEGYLSNDWHKEWAKVKSIDSDATSLTLNTYTQYGVAPGFRIAIVNALEEIDIPGEWYADSNTMKMYYYPPYELTANDTFEIATLMDNFISVMGASYINFEGIEFAKNADSPLYSGTNTFGGNGIAVLSGASDINIKNCILRDIGIDGIILSDSNNIKVDGCLIYNTGYSGMAVNCGERITQTSGNAVISNCIISNINRDSGSNGMAGIRLSGVGTIIENNIFHNIPNSAIRYSGTGHIIKNNEIYNSVNETADAGAIYAGRNWANYGTNIVNNYFHDIGAGIDTSYQASAVFWDDNHSGNSFIGNIVVMNNMTKTSGIKIGGGRDNVVDSNIFVNSAYGVYGEDRTVEPPDNYNPGDKYDFYNSTAFQSFKEATDNVSNAYYITEDDWLESYKTLYPGIMLNFYEIINEHKYSRVEQITDNVSYNCSDKAISIPSKMNADSTIENNITVSEDVFVNPSMGDYRIKLSEKIKLGLSDNIPDSSFDMDNIGLKNNYTIPEEIAEFDLIYPRNNENIASDTTSLKWNKSPFADSYVYEIASDSNFTNIVKSGTTAYNTVTVDGLEIGEDYYWRVKAVNNSRQLGCSYYSKNVSRFSTVGEIIVENITYDKILRELMLTIQNTKDTDETFSLIVAVKDNNDKLISMKTWDIQISKQDKKSISVSTGFTEAANGVVEVYAWDSLNSMINLMNKKVFNM